MMPVSLTRWTSVLTPRTVDGLAAAARRRAGDGRPRAGACPAAGAARGAEAAAQSAGTAAQLGDGFQISRRGEDRVHPGEGDHFKGFSG